MASFAHQATSLFAEEFLTLPLDRFCRIVDRKMEEVLHRQRAYEDNDYDGEKEDKIKTTTKEKRRKRVVVIGCQARCGGTLLLQCFEEIAGGVRVFNEPEIFYHYVKQNGDLALLKRTLFCFCRDFWRERKEAENDDDDDDEAPSTLVLKMPPQNPTLLKSLLDLEDDLQPFFDMSFLALYRNPVDVTKSLVK